MTEAEWRTAIDAVKMARWVFFTQQRTPRKLRLIATGWCRQLLPLVENVAHLAELVDSMEAAADGGTPWDRVEQLYQQCDREERDQSAWIVAAVWEAILLAYAPEPFGGSPHGWPVGVCSVASRGLYDGTERLAPEILPNLVWPLRDIFGNPFRPIAFSPAWRTDTAVALAYQMYEAREFSAMPILADALQDAGCDNSDILDHCRDTTQAHVRGCWVVDLLLGKE